MRGPALTCAVRPFDNAARTCYIPRRGVTKITHAEITACGAHTTRAADHGHPVPAGARHARGGDGRTPGQHELLHRAHPVAGARNEGARAPRGTWIAIHVHPGGA